MCLCKFECICIDNFLKNYRFRNEFEKFSRLDFNNFILCFKFSDINMIRDNFFLIKCMIKLEFLY